MISRIFSKFIVKAANMETLAGYNELQYDLNEFSDVDLDDDGI